MFVRFMFTLIAVFVFTFGFVALGEAGGDKKKGEKKKEVWTDAGDPTIPIDFKFQGEYMPEKIESRTWLGCQVIALGKGAFQAVFHQNLPGEGTNGTPRYLMDGKLEGDKVVFVPATGKRKYLAQNPLEFAAITKNIGEAPKDANVTISGDPPRMSNGLVKKMRNSFTLGLKPPAGAIVLFDGSNKDEWNGGRLDKTTGLLNTDGSDITTKRKFSSYTVHAEFMLPFRPDARGQGRGNSGFYQVDQYEVQILDSFGLEGRHDECGGIYSRIAPLMNACRPPLQWQTYDIDFTNAVREDGKVTKKSRITVRLNGGIIHDNVEIPGVTGGARALDKNRDEPEGTPGILRLQGHGNPLQFKNIWIVEKK